MFITAVFFILVKKDIPMNLAYVPSATDSKNPIFTSFKTAPIMKGDSGINQLFIADSKGSFIKPYGKLNYIIAGDGPDVIQFDLIKTDIIDKKVNVIEAFDTKNDKLELFVPFFFNDTVNVIVIHSDFDGKPVTYIEVRGKHNRLITAIALLGYIDINPEDIVLICQ